MPFRPFWVVIFLVLIAIAYQNCSGARLAKPIALSLSSGRGGPPLPPPPTSDPFYASPMSAGGSVSCALRGSEPFCWGYFPSQSTIPMLMNMQEPQPNPITLVATGAQLICFALTNGDIKCAGGNSLGELGKGFLGGADRYFNSRVAIPATESGAITSISAGENSACATKAGKVWCWGENNHGQKGSGDTVTDGSPVEALSPGVVKVAVGGKHTCALMSSGQMMCWGYNYFGQLGNGDRSDYSIPQVVKDPTGAGPLTGISNIAVGSYHSCALRADGKLLCWGHNTDSLLGSSGVTSEAVSLPVEILLPAGTRAHLATGFDYTCLAINESMWCWGKNDLGQLGVGDRVNRTTPSQITSQSGSITSISAGYNHTCASISGVAWCWGSNASSLLGNGDTQNSNVPVRVFSPLGTP